MSRNTIRFGICTGFGLLTSAMAYFEGRYEPDVGWHLVYIEMTTVYGLGLLYPAIRFLYHSAWFRPPTSYSLPLLLVLFAVFSFVSVVSMDLLRIPLYLIGLFDIKDYCYLGRVSFEWPRSLIGGAVMLVFCFMEEYIQKTKQVEAEFQSLQQDFKHAKLQTVRGQLSPHFLFNSLNTISFLALSKPASAFNAIQSLSLLLRQFLQQRNRKTIPLSEEIENAKAYVAMMAYRYPDQIVLDIQVDSCLLNSQVPIFLFQPLIENAIQKNIGSESEALNIVIAIGEQSDKLLITVSNSLKTNKSKHVGFGVGVRSSKDQLAYALKNGGDLTFVKTDDHAETRISIPLSKTC